MALSSRPRRLRAHRLGSRPGPRVAADRWRSSPIPTELARGAYPINCAVATPTYGNCQADPGRGYDVRHPGSWKYPCAAPQHQQPSSRVYSEGAVDGVPLGRRRRHQQRVRCHARARRASVTRTPMHASRSKPVAGRWRGGWDFQVGTVAVARRRGTVPAPGAAATCASCEFSRTQPRHHQGVDDRGLPPRTTSPAFMAAACPARPAPAVRGRGRDGRRSRSGRRAGACRRPSSWPVGDVADHNVAALRRSSGDRGCPVDSSSSGSPKLSNRHRWTAGLDDPRRSSNTVVQAGPGQVG